MNGNGMTAMDGFMKGYSFMDQVYANEAQRERQTELDRQHDEDRTDQKKLQGVQMESAQIGLERQKTEQKREVAARAANKLQSGFEPDDEEAAALREITGWGDDIDSGATKMEESINILEGAYNNGRGMRDFNKPEVLGALSTVLNYDLHNRQHDGMPVGGTRQIDRIVPGAQPGTLSFSLSGTYEDSTPFSGQPMTVKRGRVEDGDNDVAQIPVASVMSRVEGQKRLLAAYKKDPDGFKRLMRANNMAQNKADELMAVYPWQDVINKRTGEKVYSGDAKTKYNPYTRSGGGASGSGDTAFIKNARFQFDKMPKIEGENEDQRWARALAAAAQKTTTSPTDAKAKIYNEVLKASLPDNIDFMDETDKNAAYSYAEAAASRAANYGGQFLYPDPGKGGKTSPPALGLTPAPKQGAIKDAYKHSSGKTFTRAEIEARAKKTNTTPEAVIQQYGLQ